MVENNNIKRVQAYIGSMPSLPTSVNKVMEICNDPKMSPMDLNRVISLDPVLMGKVLKLINSAYYGLQNQVTTLIRAIIMLGVNTVKNLALSTAVLDKLSDKSGFRALNMEGFWRHSLCVGVVSKMLAKKKGIPAQKLDEYFVAGLLHDIGKIPLNNVLSDLYIKAMVLADNEKIPVYLAEMRTVDIDHTEIGKMICREWNLDKSISDAIQYHHSLDVYSGDNRSIVEAVIIADYYANREGIGFSGCLYPEKVPNEVYDSFGIKKDWLIEIDSEVSVEIDKASIFLKLK